MSNHQQIVPKELFVPFRPLNIETTIPKDETLKELFDALINDMGLSEEAIAKMQKFTPKKQWQFIQGQAYVDSMSPSPECFLEYLKTAPNITVINSLYVNLSNGKVSWMERFIKDGLSFLISLLTKTKDKDMDVFCMVLQCLHAIANVDVGQKAMLKETELFDFLIKSFEVKNSKAFGYILSLCIPFIYYSSNHSKVAKKFADANVYNTIKKTCENNPDHITIRQIVVFLTAMIFNFQEMKDRIDFIIFLYQSKLLDTLQAIKLTESERTFQIRKNFFDNIEEDFKAVKELFPSSRGRYYNPFSDKSMRSCLSKHTSKTNLRAINLSLADIVLSHSKRKVNMSLFIANLLTIYRQYVAKGLNLSIE